MKIEKLNENQIRFTLTREDLASRQIRLSELAYGSEKARSLFQEMMQMACLGSGVLETRSVELASKYQVPLYLGKALEGSKKRGTWIMEHTKQLEDMPITGLSVKDDYATRKSVLITTFIHELFHVWIYSTCGEKRYTVREIEEAMVEFVTLYFLKQISQENKEFEPILKYAVRSVRQKQAVFGRLAANGYGYYLYSLLPNNEQQVLNLFIAYSKNSGLIKPSPFVKHIIIMLDSLYPFEREEEVFECLQKLLLDEIYG